MTARPPPEASAEAAGLRYVDDDEPGFTRRRHGRGFAYYAPDGSHVKDDERTARFEALAIPPAWTDVWICRDERGHLQATGRDDADRKQYIYHPRWREVRERAKFDGLIPFAEALPALRRRVRRDLRRDELSRRRVTAAIVKLLETTLVRVGNESYARENETYGATTFRGRHVEIDDDEVALEFTGKSGTKHELSVRNERLAEVVHRCSELPGHQLFQYLGEAGRTHTIDSADVNAYLRRGDAAEGRDFSAKDFRTWAATVAALAQLRRAAEAEAGEDAEEASAAERDRTVAETLERVAERLGNTPAVCRDSYVHPRLPQLYREGKLLARLEAALEVQGEPPRGLRRDEAAALALLRAQHEEDA